MPPSIAPKPLLDTAPCGRCAAWACTVGQHLARSTRGRCDGPPARG